MTDLFSAAMEAGTYEPPPRPEYPVRTMDDVRKIPWNGLTCVGSFSGCGGSSMGLRYAGYRIPVAIEFVPEAAKTYRENSPSTLVIERDIRQVTGAEIMSHLGIQRGDLDVYEGSPPCSSWSAAGTGHKTRERACDECEGIGKTAGTIERESEDCAKCEGTGRLAGESKKYSDLAQRTDDLFDHYVRLIDEMMPRAFIAENVPGLIRGDGEAYANYVTGLLSDLGYSVEARVMNSMHYGAATARERLIFLGVRRDLGVPASLPRPTVPDPFTTGEALAVVREDHPEDVADSSMEGKAVGRTWKELRAARLEGREPRFTELPCENCGLPGYAHRVKLRDSDRLVVPSMRQAGEEPDPDWERNGTINKAVCEDGSRAKFTKGYFLAVLADENAPCPTITATGAQTGAASVMHPTECRKFTPREAATISGFPHDFILTGTRDQRYERIGRAVTPPLYEAVGRHLAGLLARAEGR